MIMPMFPIPNAAWASVCVFSVNENRSAGSLYRDGSAANKK